MVKLAFAALAACTGSDDPGDTGADDGNAEVAFAPAEGDWVEEPVVYVDDGCGVGEDGGTETSPFVLTVTGTEAFEMRYPSEYEEDTVVTCSLDDRTFTCDPITSETNLEDQGFEATVTVEAEASGSFSSETEGHVDATISVECVGADCDTVNPYGNCTTTGGYDIHTSPAD